MRKYAKYAVVKRTYSAEEIHTFLSRRDVTQPYIRILYNLLYLEITNKFFGKHSKKKLRLPAITIYRQTFNIPPSKYI